MKRFHLLMENLRDYVVLMMDERGVIVDFNADAARILRFQGDVLLGNQAATIFTPDDRDHGIPEQEMRMARYQGRCDDERWHLRMDNTRIWVRGALIGLRDDHGQFQGYVKIMQDFTERKMAEEALARSNRDLQHFASIVSHDLQAPITRIISFVDLLKQELGENISQKLDLYAKRIENSAHRARVLIRDLLEYSRLSSEVEPLGPAPLDEIMQDVLEDLKPKIEKTKAEVRVDALPVVTGNPVQLHRLLLNLVDNALKFRSKGDIKIAVRANRKEGEWVISVRDNGIGIPEEHKDRIFEIFHRLHSTSDYPGSGIGLSICKRIVERHGGQIWLDSAPDAGTTFYFSMPAPTLHPH